MNAKDLWDELGVQTPTGPLDVPLRFRVEQDLVDDLDKVEASLRGAGYRVSRSTILRALLAAAMEGLREDFPLQDIQLPGAGVR